MLSHPDVSAVLSHPDVNAVLNHPDVNPTLSIPEDSTALSRTGDHPALVSLSQCPGEGEVLAHQDETEPLLDAEKLPHPYLHVGIIDYRNLASPNREG